MFHGHQFIQNLLLQSHHPPNEAKGERKEQEALTQKV